MHYKALTVLQSGPKPAMEIQKEPGKDIAIESDRKGESVLRVLNDPNLGPYRMTSGRTGFHYEFESITLAALERFLNEGYLDRPLLDQTGLNGAYQITVDSPFPTNLVGSNEPAGDSVEDSLRKSGLQLVRTRANVEKLVIDRIARTPMEN